jgi:hypothetical protein
MGNSTVEQDHSNDAQDDSNADRDELAGIDPSGESELRGEALAGIQGKRSLGQTAQAKHRNPDAVLHLDNEEDTLYNDGIEIEDDSQTLADTHGKDA